MVSIKLNPKDFKTFRECCQGLPHVQPRGVKNLAQKCLYALDAEEGDSPTTAWENVEIRPEDLRGLFHITKRSGYAVNVVSPAGARLLVRLYKAGALPMVRGKAPDAVSETLTAYCRQ